mgnify:CR=1 FL=1
MDPGCSCPDKGTPGGMCHATRSPLSLSSLPVAAAEVGRNSEISARRVTPERGGACGSVLLVRIYVVEGAYALALFSALTFVLISWFVSRQYARYGRFAGWPAGVSAAQIFYGCALITFTLFPIPDYSTNYCARRADVQRWQLDPLTSLDNITAYAQANGALATAFSPVLWQVMLNVIFFVPLGFFLAYRSRRSLPTTTALAAGTSVLIELTQGTGLWGLLPCPYRIADVDDVITNTSGAILGWFLAVALRRSLPDPRPQPTADPGPPSPMRQAVGVLLDVQIYLIVQIGVFVLVNPALQGIIDLNSAYVFEVMVTLVTFTLFAFIPMLRDDRASPGLASVHLVVARKDGSTHPAALWSVLVRWIVRWLPVTLFGLPALLVILPIEALVSWRTEQHRSLASMLSRTVLVTREHLRGAKRSEADQVTT